ncbi:MAG: hypothetical protein U9O87_00260 [Verrucomicrobiota bacterium]|nr:hypothetical protein [Verrucomicrobiota bacterium]
MSDENKNKDSVTELDLLKFDKKIFIFSLLKRIPIVLISGIFFFVIAAFLAKKFSTQKWKGVTILYKTSRNSRLKSTLPFLYRNTNIKNIIKTIKTKENLLKVIKKLKLDMTVGDLSEEIELEFDKKTDNITLLIVTENKKPYKIVNSLAEVFINSYLDTRKDSAQQIWDDYIKNRTKITQEIKILKEETRNFLLKNNVSSINTEIEVKYKQLNELELQLLFKKMKLTALNSKIEDLKKTTKGMKDKVPLSFLVTKKKAIRLEGLKEEFDRLKQKFTTENPKLLKIKDEIIQLQKKIDSEPKLGENTPPIPNQMTYGGNSTKSALELSQIEIKMEVNSLIKNMKELKESIFTIKEKVKLLSKLQEPYSKLKKRINLKESQVDTIDTVIAEAKIVMATKLSDFKILSKAIPPKFPEPTKTKLLAVAGAFFGFASSFVIVVLFLLTDLTVKSKYSIVDILKIPLIGNLPNKDEVDSSVFYPAIQILFNNIASSDDQKSPAIIGVSSDKPDTGKSFVIENACRFLEDKQKKILVIDSLKDAPEDIKDFIINDSLYSNGKIVHEKFNILNENIHKAYFVLNEKTFLSSLNKKEIKSWLNTLNKYDYIFWELFNYSQNKQLFTDIMLNMSLKIVVARFRQTNKMNLFKLLNFMKRNEITDINAVLNYVNRRSYDGEL